MYERIYNALAVLTLVGVLFIVWACPIVFDTYETTETPQRANLAVTRDVKTIAEGVIMPDVSLAFEVEAAREDAKEKLDAVLSVYGMVTAINPKAIKLEYAGEFFLTMYAATVEQCGNTLGITASGKKVTTDPTCRTVAVDPSVIPLGTYLIIEGYDGIVWQATDTGSAVNGYHIDLFTDSEAESLSFPNVNGAQVWIIKD